MMTEDWEGMSWERALCIAARRNREMGWKGYRVGVCAVQHGGSARRYWYAPIPVPVVRAS